DRMDGFVKAAEQGGNRGCGYAGYVVPVCVTSNPSDVMGYHDAREIPNYWTYAKDFVLQDHMFEPVASWSVPAHLYLVSGWSAHCKTPDPSTCTSDIIQAHIFLSTLIVPSFRRCALAHGLHPLLALQLPAGSLTPRERQGLITCLAALSP